MERLLAEEGQWPRPRDDPELEPSEPWARTGQSRRKPHPAWEEER